MDLGLNRFGFALYSCEGDFTNGVQQSATEFNQPPAAFVTTAHEGSLGGSFSFASISDAAVAVRAIKKAEESDEIIVRVNETSGRPKKNIVLAFASDILTAAETNGAEEYLRAAKTEGNKLIFDLGKFEVKTFSLKLKQTGKETARNREGHATA